MFINKYEIERHRTKYKLFYYRKFMTTTMIDALKNLTLDRIYTTLKEAVNKFLNFDKHIEFLLEDEAKNHMLVTFTF
jgi:hypothetical protein